MSRNLNFSVIDNFCSDLDYETLEKLIFSNEVNWTSNNSGWAKPSDTSKVFTFLHYIQHDFKPVSPIAEEFLGIFKPLIDQLGNPLLARLIYTEKTNEHIASAYHTDLNLPHHAVIWFYNDNNGSTEFDGISVNCRKNRLLSFDSALHRVVTNTDDQPRIVAHFVFPITNEKN